MSNPVIRMDQEGLQGRTESRGMESVDMRDVLAIFETLKVGQEIDSKNIILKETDDNYFFNK